MARDARIPPPAAASLARGETAFLCETPRSLPPAGTPPADFVVLPFAFAWLYPDSMLVVEALHFARRGLVLHGTIAGGAGSAGGDAEPAAIAARLRRLMEDLRLTAQWRDDRGRPIDEAAASGRLAAGTAVLRAERA